MISFQPEGIFFNGVKKTGTVWGRSSFKLSNILTYHFTGQGGGRYGLGTAMEWIHFNQRIFGQDVLLRVFLETAGWSPCSDCMFGGDPRDQGFWDRELLRDGNRETEVHGVGRDVLEWLFRTSQEEGVAFELVIDATLKHDDIPKGEIDHVIRVVGIEMGRLAQVYPRALIIPSMRNEWDAHNESGHTLYDVNQWAVRWDRDDYWPEAAKIVDPGGGNEFTYEVGPEDGKYRAGMIHPDRGDGWERFPDSANLSRLRQDCRGMPLGFTESMYYVEPEDVQRATRWYRASGWTTDWGKYETFLDHVEGKVDYFIIHDEKGAQSDPAWPRAETRVDAWARNKFGGVGPPPPPPPLETGFTIPRDDEKELAFTRDPEIVRGGSESFVLRDSIGKLVPGRKLERIHVFHGLDRGDIVEMDTEVIANDKSLFLRSEHKETEAPFDAWKTWDPIDYDEEVRSVKISVLCRVNGENRYRPQGQRLSARPHWGIRIVWK